MKKLLTIAIGLLVASFAHAGPLAFTSTQAQTAVAVVSQNDADAQSGQSPPDALPVVSSSTLVDATSFVSASAIAADGLLSTQAEGDSVAGFTSAVSSAQFIGDFVGASSKLALDFVLDLGDSADPQAFSASSLVVTLLQDGVPFYSEVFAASGAINRLIDLVYGATYSLDILATSEANTTVGGNAFASALASVQIGAVPEPSTMVLMLAPIVMLVVARRRRLPTPV